MFDINSITNDTPFTDEEGFELTKFYVHYFWVTNKFYSLKATYEEEDVVDEVFCKFLRTNHLKKFNPHITSKKYHIMNGVRTSMIDLLRKQRDVASLDKETEEGTPLGNLIEDEHQNAERESLGQVGRDRIISLLPVESRSKICGYSPLLHKQVNISYQVLALHLEAGYTPKQMSEFYINPSNGKHVSVGSISKYITELREYILDNIVLS